MASPGGSQTDDQLRSEVTEAEVLIGVISQSSVKSAYVIFELGARWGSRKPMVPLLAPDFDPGQLEGPLKGIHARSCRSAGDIHQLLQDISRLLNRPLESAAAFQRHIDEIVAFSKRTPDSQSGHQTKILPAALGLAQEVVPQQTVPKIESAALKEREILRLERLLKPLPGSHLEILRRLSSGPQQLTYKSEIKDSLVGLKLIRYIGKVTSEYGLFESVSEDALVEYFRRLRARTLPGLLKSLSPQERQFMNLFLLEDPLKELANPKTGLLPRQTYSASQSLREKALLSLTKIEVHFQSFSLSPDVVPLLPEILSKSVLRTEIRLDMNKVEGIGATGSGIHNR